MMPGEIKSLGHPPHPPLDTKENNGERPVCPRFIRDLFRFIPDLFNPNARVTINGVFRFKNVRYGQRPTNGE